MPLIAIGLLLMLTVLFERPFSKGKRNGESFVLPDVSGSIGRTQMAGNKPKKQDGKFTILPQSCSTISIDVTR